MAKRKHHRRHHHKGFGEFVTVPTLGDLKEYNPLSKNVNSTDVFVGAGLGLAVGAAIKLGVNKINVSMTKADGTGGLPAAVMTYAGPISTFLAGLLLYMTQRKANRGRAEGQFIGATLAAATPVYWSVLGQYGPKLSNGTPFFSDYVMIPGSSSAPQLQGYVLQGYGAPEQSSDYPILEAP